MTFNLSNINNNNVLDKILPPYGSPRVQQPVWDENQKMFIISDYESASGHRYYMGLRFCNQMVVVEKVGLYHTWTYIDAIEIYAYNGTKLELVQKRDYEKQFRNEAFVRQETEELVRNYISSSLKLCGSTLCQEEINAQAHRVVNDCYKSFLDNDFPCQLLPAIPQINYSHLLNQ